MTATCSKRGKEFIKNHNARQKCKDCSPVGYQYKPIRKGKCVICGKAFSGYQPNKILCGKKECDLENRRRWERKTRKALVIKRKTPGLSQCPHCGIRHNGDSRWEYCTKHIWCRGFSDYEERFGVVT